MFMMFKKKKGTEDMGNVERGNIDEGYDWVKGSKWPSVLYKRQR